MKQFKTILLVFLVVSAISVVSTVNFASAQTGMSLTATAEKYSSTIMVSGQTTKSSDITITVTSPNYNVVTIDQVKPDLTGNYQAKIQVSSLWKQDGFYTITAQQGSINLHNLSVELEVAGGKVLTTMASDSSLVDQFKTGVIAPERGLKLFADAVPGSTTITISGETTSQNPITLRVTAPNGNVVSVNQIQADINGEFNTKITTGGPLWKQDGFYTVSAQQGESAQFKQSVKVEIVDGAVIPEFGTIAALILAVAIISIVAVSARSRLSIIPRY